MKLILLIALALSAAMASGCASGSSEQETPDSVLRTQLPKIDVHTHFQEDHPDLTPVLEDWNMRSAIVMTGGEEWLRELRQGMNELSTKYPDRFIRAVAFNPFRFNEPGFVDSVLAQLDRDIADDARMVKVWKNIGLEVKDENGNFVQIDHPKFQPIWDFLAERDIPVLAHIAEPRAAWQPLNEQSPHYHYYSTHPQYHAYNLPELPNWEEIIAARDNWLRSNPNLTVIGAHLGSMAHDVNEVEARLDSFPNFYVETAERFGDLTNQPSDRVRQFMIDYQDRILYGTDVLTVDAELGRLDTILTLHWDYLTSADSVDFDNNKITFSNRTKGLDLPEAVLRKIYHDNAVRLLKL